ncbi:tRNA (adenosine(37)-N6)-dimethylallyltransferase MiaA [Lactobacillus sp. S2-2]|uniref:tRNA (adenosine(37)-N6)-dimethylallyltransferase MiaA n=1 Tax=Lactobacillus sp. S2-2 TaxID=2692917 RepID=UPI001F0133DE|nr:tRNA (adenosine(37)-N6)-dimethylallyltransferase MiaA [Lactobacillus sp. S2-2]MCF6515118.1 tRNA (adenosine(37)-N6)-dimethylallyltransferase MiaA [Lactobacillus sp. S2-2]
MDKLLVIAGPTAVGKTKLSIEIAKKFNGEIISGDSMQVYRNLNIGTAKIQENEMENIPHHLIDVRNFNERFSVSDFIEVAKKLIKEINKRGKLPIIVGGTGFYLSSLLNNYQLGNDSFNQDKRDKIEDYLEKNGKHKLWNYLFKIDPKAAINIPENNTRRVKRAIEVFENTGELFSNQNDKNDNSMDEKNIILNTDRNILYERINTRVDKMINEGLLKEAKWLYDHRGYDYQSGKGIGYKEFNEYFKGNQSLEESINLVKQNSRHYAKRQLTWFRNKMNADWFDIVKDDSKKNDIFLDIEKWMEE